MKNDRQRRLKWAMTLIILVGLLLASTGLGLAIFTKTATHHGITGVLVITGLIVGGLALSVPAKLYLTLQLMRLSDEKPPAMPSRKNSD